MVIQSYFNLLKNIKFNLMIYFNLKTFFNPILYYQLVILNNYNHLLQILY